MTPATLRRAFLVLAVLLSTAAFSGCAAGPLEGEGDTVLVVRNATNATANVEIVIHHSSESALPNEGDPAVEGKLKVEDGQSGAFLFSLPDDIRAATVNLNGYRRLFVPDQLAQCPVLVFELAPRGASFLGCGPGDLKPSEA